MSDMESRLAADRIARDFHLLQSLVETVPHGLCLLDRRQQLLYANGSGYMLLQLLLPQRPGATTKVLPGYAIDTLASKPLSTYQDEERHEVTLEQPAPRRIAVSIHPVLAPSHGDEHAPAWVLLLRDITERSRRADHSREQERLAAVGQLAAGLAHDFNNILASIVLYSQLLAEEAHISHDGRRRLQVIQEQTKRATGLVRQILDFSRRSVIQRSEVDVVALCRELIETWRHSFPPTIDITFQHHAAHYVVSADASRLKQALLNLAINAQEAMPRGGRLSLTLSHRHIGLHDTVPQLGMEPGRWLEIMLADTGSGIPPEALPHVFEPFFSSKPLHEGAGLGLPQVHGIVHQHGGHVKVESELHRGTVITIYLPLQQDITSLPELSGPLPDRLALLIVEQDDLLRKALGDALQDAGLPAAYQLVLASHGQEALFQIRQQRLQPALVIGDLALPQMSGLALLRALREQNPHCRMIIISSYPMPANGASLKAAGIAAWLPKPFSMTDLLQQINNLLSA